MYDTRLDDRQPRIGVQSFWRVRRRKGTFIWMRLRPSGLRLFGGLEPYDIERWASAEDVVCERVCEVDLEEAGLGGGGDEEADGGDECGGGDQVHSE